MNTGFNDNISNWKLGRDFAREGNFSEANRHFEAELTHSNPPNSLVLDDHGHLLNRMGKYQDAIDKFENLLNSVDDYVSSLFGIGISYIGLNKLDDALKYFKKVNKLDEGHADAWYYSAIIYGNPFYRHSNIKCAERGYNKYRKYKESYIKNQDYFQKPFNNLTWDELHNYYKCSSLFRLIEQSLEKGNLYEFVNFFNKYKKLYCFDEDDLDKQFDIVRLFDDDIPLDYKIDNFHEEKNIEDKFESAGFEDDLINGLSSKLGLISIEDKKKLNEIMDYSKISQLSFNDINELVRENVLGGYMSLDVFYENREDIFNKCIKKNKSKYQREVEKRVNVELKKQVKINKELKLNLNEKDDMIKELKSELKVKNDEFVELKCNLNEKDDVIDKLKSELKVKNDEVVELKCYLNEKNEGNQKLEDNLSNNYESLSNENIIQSEHSSDNYDFSTTDIKSLMENHFSDLKKSLDSRLEEMESYLNNDQDVSSMNILSGINNQCYQDDLDYIKNECDLSEDNLKNLKNAFKAFYNGNFGSASHTLGLDNLRKAFNETHELKNYRILLKVTSMSCENVLDDENFNIYIKKNLKLNVYKKNKEGKLDKGIKLKKEKYPMGWFNLGNICFDYANSQSVGSTKKSQKNAKEAYELAYFCYKCAKNSISNSEENSDYVFKFKDKKNEQEFKNNVLRMISNCEIKILQQKIKDELKTFDELQNKISDVLEKWDNFNENDEEIF